MIARLLDLVLPRVRLGGLTGGHARRRSWGRAGLIAQVEVRSASNWMGRFGGGWQWAVGVKAGGTRARGTVLVELLVGTLRVDWGAP